MNTTENFINQRRKKILQERYDRLLNKENCTKHELKEMQMIKKRLKKL